MMLRQVRTAQLTVLGIIIGLAWHPNAIGQETASMLQPLAEQNPQDISMIAIMPTLTSQVAPATSIADKLAELDAYLNAYDETGRLSGNVIITQGSEPAFIRSYGLANREHGVANAPVTKFRIGSITKQFTAVAILQLQEQGLVD
ncbi:MAG: serine hydrolase domain-containing protein, partial [Cyanobacteria bacterium J06636_28]